MFIIIKKSLSFISTVKNRGENFVCFVETLLIGQLQRASLSLILFPVCDLRFCVIFFFAYVKSYCPFSITLYQDIHLESSVAKAYARLVTQLSCIFLLIWSFTKIFICISLLHISEPLQTLEKLNEMFFLHLVF